MQQLVVIRRFMQQPLMVVFGVLTGASAAKTGHGAWAAGGILTLLSIYFGAVVTSMATRSLAAWVARMRRYEHANGRGAFMVSAHKSMPIIAASPHRATL